MPIDWLALQALYPSHDELFSFEWPVDQGGYELEEEPVFGLRPRGGPVRMYRPLEEFPGLFRRFANLPLDQPKAMQDFANQFGLLVCPQVHERWGHRAHLLGENLIGDKIDAEGQFESLIDLWGVAIVTIRSVVAGIESDQKPGQQSGQGFEAAFLQLTSGNVQPLFTFGVAASGTSKHPRPILRARPVSLLSAMWLQIAGEVTQGIKFKKCRVCPNWFTFGEDTNKRRTRKYCSNACKQKWHRQEKRKKL